METLKTRRAELELLYGGKDISTNVAPCCVAFSYTDNAHGKADEISVTLEDSSGLWAAAWLPDKGARLTARIVCHDWERPGQRLVLPCGVFEVDEVEVSGPPDVVQIKAVSAAVTTSLRGETKTRAWESVTLEAVAEQIAEANGLTLRYESDQEIVLERVDQREASDLKFLQAQAERHGLKLKVSDDQLILFEGKKYDAKGAVRVIRRGESAVSRFRVKTKAGDVFEGCEVEYQRPEDDEPITHAFKPDDAPKVGQTLKVKKRAESQADAEDLAKSELRKKNERESEAELTLMGDPVLVAGANVTLAGFGRLDGKFAIESATHTLSRSQGYSTSVSLRKALGY